MSIFFCLRLSNQTKAYRDIQQSLIVGDVSSLDYGVIHMPLVASNRAAERRDAVLQTFPGGIPFDDHGDFFAYIDRDRFDKLDETLRALQVLEQVWRYNAPNEWCQFLTNLNHLLRVAADHKSNPTALLLVG